MKMMILAVGGAPEQRFLDDAAFVLERGGQVTLVITRLEPAPAIDSRIEVLELAEHEARRHARPQRRAVIPCRIAPISRLVAPRRIVFGRVQRSNARPRPEAATAGAVPAAQPSGRGQRARRGLRRALYRPLRGALLSGVALRHLVHDVEVESFDVVVAADRPSIAPAWRLARRAQRPQVGYQLSRESWRGS